MAYLSPFTRRSLRRFPPLALAVLLGWLALPSARAARTPAPTTSVPLEDLGFIGGPPRYLLLGDTVFTVHFVDNKHLLVTFASRGLLKRLPDSQPQDQDQNVDAVLLDLPSGQVLARTAWRMRDRGRYLWPIGHGRFLLRTRTHLSLLTPLENLSSGKPFQEEPLFDLQRKIAYIAVSPGADLLSIETLPLPKPVPPAPSAASSGTPVPPTRPQPELRTPKTSEVQINFFRMRFDPSAGKPGHLLLQSAGVVRAPNLIEIPATAEGYLDMARESPGTYLFDFQVHGGTRMPLSPFDTTCAPRPHFVSRSEFIAFGCRGSDDRPQMAGFNLRGEETWINAFSSRHYFPYLAEAPAAGRFALSQTQLTGTYLDLENLSHDEIGPQEVSVIQNADGRLLLKLAATPFQRAGQNFDLSPDGLSLAIIHDQSVQVYPLPPLTRGDRDAILTAEKDVPPPTEARIDLGGKPSPRPSSSTVQNAENAPASPPSPPVAASSATSQHSSAAATKVASQTELSPAQSQAAQAREPNQPVNGDPDPSQRRTPPSLYSKDYPRDPDSHASPDPQ